MRVIQNVSYRPDMQGIEYLWKTAKEQWRKRVINIRVQGLALNLIPLVENVLDQIPESRVKACAA